MRTLHAIPAIVICLALSNAASAQLAAIFSPVPGATAVCPDTPLRIAFGTAPTTDTGTIQVFDAADNSPVATIDVSKKTLIRTIGGLPNFNYYPIIITGNQADLFLPQPLAYGKTYYVKIDAGAFKDPDGKALQGITDATAWRFTTKPAPPAAGASKLIVAADSSADFATVQGALDFIPDANDTPVTVFIKNGTYTEIVFFTNKNKITIQGKDRQKTIIAYPNNNRFNPNSGGNPFGISTTAPAGTTATAPAAVNPHRGSVYRRGMFLAHHVDDLTITNLTLHNTTPQGGSQAEAIILNGTPTAHAILKDVDLASYQDTLQINGQAYLTNCHIDGDVDFMWGTGPCFFDHCTANSLRSKAYFSQIRNQPGKHGYVYKDCTFEGAPGITGNFLSRIDPTRFGGSEVVLIDCTLTDAVGAVAWQLNHATTAPDVHFWEFKSHDPDGKPVDTSQRLSWSKQLKEPDDAQTIDNYADPKFVLGGDWNPTAPTTQP